MSGFEFVFSLSGLILGLALAAGPGGLARALKASVRIGWPTARLATVARDRRVVLACLVWPIALYPLSAVWH